MDKSRSGKKYRTVLIICLIAWQALFAWACLPGKNITDIPWFARFVPLTLERWEWLIAAPQGDSQDALAAFWINAAAWIGRTAFVMITAFTIYRRWKTAALAERIYYLAIVVISSAAYFCFISSIWRSYELMSDWIYLWQSVFDVELLAITVLLVVFAVPWAKKAFSAPE